MRSESSYESVFYMLSLSRCADIIMTYLGEIGSGLVWTGLF
jgi:hypothetical protein